MEKVINIVSIVLLITAIVLLFKRGNKGIIITLFVLSAISRIFLVLDNTSVTTNIILPDDILETITKVDWEDREELLSLGFTVEDGKFTYTSSQHKITVENGYSSPDQTTSTEAKTYKNISYEFSQTSEFGRYSIRRLWKDDIHCWRYCSVDVGTKTLFSAEFQTTENTPNSIEVIISELQEKLNANEFATT